VFGQGFSRRIYSPGLVIVAAGLIAGLAEGTSASLRLTAMIDGCRKLTSNRIAGGLGLIAGLGASPSAAFALLSPLLRPIGGREQTARGSTAVALALAISGSHGVAVLSPVVIASVSILGADWDRAALFGIPLAIFLVWFGATFARIAQADEGARPLDQSSAETLKTGPGTRWSGIVLVLATMLPLFMLIFQSFADVSSEPLGGGQRLEMIAAIGRPLILLLVGVGVMVIGLPRQGLRLLGDSTWAEHILAKMSGTILIVCAAGGFAALCQRTAMAEALSERALGWHLAPILGLGIPFLIAAAMKTLQGSSLAAAITAAGMVQPQLMQLGFADSNGRTLVALAVGAGAMTVSHVNDDYFWLVARSVGFSPLRAVGTVSLGTLLQGLIALSILLCVSFFLSHI
jgi:gluconate:H+ symporter, GntP family